MTVLFRRLSPLDHLSSWQNGEVCIIAGITFKLAGARQPSGGGFNVLVPDFLVLDLTQFDDVDGRVRHLGVVRRSGLVRQLAAEEDPTEGSAELDGHGVVKDRVYGAVHVDHDATEEHEPVIVVRSTGERVENYEGTVGKPEHGEHADNHGKHLRYLSADKTVVLLQ